MAWYLNVVRATNIHAAIPTPLTVAYGTDAYSLEFEIAYTDISNDQIILGNVSVTPVHAIYLTTGGRLQLTVGGTNAFFTAGGFGLNDGVFHKYRLEHDAGGAWRVYRDGILFGSGTYTGALTTTQPLNAIFKRSSATGSVTSANLRFKYLEAVGFGAGSAKWDADLSGGAGSILPTFSGTNNATLVAFPADDSEWVFYSTGATYTLTAQGGSFSYSGGSADLTYTTAGPTYKLTALGGSFSYSGGSADLLLNRKLTAQGATYNYSGGSASLLRGFKVVAQGGTFIYVGGSADLTYTGGPVVYRLTALGTTYVYSGGVATLTAGGVIPSATPGGLVIQALVGGTQSIQCRIGGAMTNNARIGGTLTNNAMVAV